MPAATGNSQTEKPVPGRKRWLRACLWSTAGLAAFLASALAWLFTADLGFLRPRIETFVTQRTGREFGIDGDLDILLGRQTVITAEGVRLQNAEWAEDPAMLEIGRCDIRFDLWSLIRGRVVVNLVDIDDARVRLARNGSRAGNWELDLPRSDDDGATRTRDIDVLLENADIDGLRITYSSPGRDQDLVADFRAIRQQRRPDGFLEISAGGTIGGRDVSLSGKVGNWDALLAGRNVEYDLQGQLDTISVASNGVIDDVTRPRRPSLRYSVSGPDVNDLTGMFGLGAEGAGDIRLQGSLIPGPDGPLVLSVSGNVGENEIESSGTFSDLASLEQADVDVLASGPDLGRLLSYFGAPEIREAAYMIRLDAERDGPMLIVSSATMVFGESRFELTARMPNFPSLDDGVIDLDINGPDIERFRYLLDLPGAATGPFSVSANLEVSPLGEESVSLDVETSLVKIEAAGPLSPRPGYLGSRLQFTLQSNDLAALASAWHVGRLPAEPVVVRGAVEVTEEGLRIREPLVGAINETIVSAQGLVKPAAGLRGSDVSFELTGSSLGGVVESFGGGTFLPPQPFVLNGRLEVLENRFRFREVDANIGNVRASADGVLALAPRIAGSRFEVRAEGPAFEEVVTEFTDMHVTPGPFDFSGTVAFDADGVEFRKLSLQRQRSSLSGDVRIGMPLSERRVRFEMKGRGSDVRQVLHGVGRFRATESPFSIAGSGRLDGSELSIDELELTVGESRASANGRLHLGGAEPGVLSLTARIPSLAGLGSVDERRFTDQALELSATVSGGAGALIADDLVARIGGSDLGGRIAVTIDDVPELAVELRSDSFVYLPLLADAEEEQAPSAPRFEDGRLIPDASIPFDAMKKLNATVDLEIGEFRRGKLRLVDVKVEADLRDGAIEVSRLEMRGKSGRLAGTARIDPAGGAGRVAASLFAREFALGLVEGRDVDRNAMDIDFALEATGPDVRTLAANANGVLLAAMSGHLQFEDYRLLRLLYGDALQGIIDTINPLSRDDPYTLLNCVVVPLAIDDGMVTSAPNEFFRTDKINIATSGALNLKDETLDVTVRTTPRRGITLSAAELLNPYVKITGTLARPKLAVDEAGLLITGGAAVATGGLTILAKGVWDRLSRSSDPCGDARKAATEALRDRLPEVPPFVAGNSTGS